MFSNIWQFNTINAAWPVGLPVTTTLDLYTLVQSRHLRTIKSSDTCLCYMTRICNLGRKTFILQRVAVICPVVAWLTDHVNVYWSMHGLIWNIVIQSSDAHLIVLQLKSEICTLSICFCFDIYSILKCNSLIDKVCQEKLVNCNSRMS